MIYVFTNAGIVAVEGGYAAVLALRHVGAQIADDLAGVASQIDDANSLKEVVQNSLNGNNLGTLKVIGAVAFGSAVTMGLLVGAIPTAGAVAIAIGFGWAAGKLYEWAFDAAIGIGQRAGAAAYDLWGEDPIDPSVNSRFNDARNIVIQVDPLVLDLDGDGLELVGANGSILFDHNADNIKTGTGWAGRDDGFLVRDLNGNGTIDTGRELFGVDTIKSNNTLATQGFDALRDLDSNADGQITSADAAFGELKVWQDANQDGISQSTELKTLAERGITRIGLNGTSTGPQAGQTINNNQVALSTTFTQNGQIKTVGAIDLEANNFFTEFPTQVVDETGNPVAITEQALNLPQMNGAGMLRNMQAAASLDADFAAALSGRVNPSVMDRVARLTVSDSV